MTESPEPGIYRGVPFAEYRRWQYPSKSTLAGLAISPAEFAAEIRGELPRKASDAYTLGSAVDHIWTEGRSLTPVEGWIVRPETNPLTGKRLPKSGKALAEYLASLPPGVATLTREQEQVAVDIVAALNSHPRACEIRANSEAQVSLVWDDPDSGIRMKGRPDLVDIDRQIVADLKTAKDITVHGFAKAASDYNYHWQLYLYTVGLAQATSTDFGDWSQYIIAARNTPIYGVAVRPMDPSAIAIARYEIGKLLGVMWQCITDNHWPANLNDETPITLPYWRRTGE